MMFDQGKYWRERGRHYLGEFREHDGVLQERSEQQEKSLGDTLASLELRSIRSVLEIGCGFGRITSLLLTLLPRNVDYVAIDISEAQITAAKDHLKKNNLRSPRFSVADFRSHRFSETFDLVVAVEVFLHFPPGEIRDVLRKAQELSARHVIHIDPFVPPRGGMVGDWARRLRNLLKGRPVKSDWVHNYLTLYNHTRIKSVRVIPILDGAQGIFIVEKK